MTLGAVRLTGREAGYGPHPILGQPKRLALLVYLVLARPGSLIPRDTLQALLWPGYTSARARNALRQTLYHLRRELGEDLFLGKNTASVGVAADRLWCDAVALERALAEDRLETVVELYAGDFLPGFHPDCGSAYERWLEEVRGRLKRKAAAAAATLAERAEAAGDVRGAVGYARRLVDLLPYEGPAARTLIRLLADGGDRVAAVRVYEALADRLFSDLGLEPDEDTRALIEAVQKGRVGSAPGDWPSTAVDADDRIAGAVVKRPAGGGRKPDGPSIAVLPFTSLSDAPSEQAFADALTERLNAELARNDGVSLVSQASLERYRRGEQALEALAREIHLDGIVEGSVLESGGRRRVTARLLAVPGGSYAWGQSFHHDIPEPPTVLPEIAASIARDAAAVFHAPADVGTGAAAARDGYFRGRHEFARMTPAGFAAAVAHFRTAIRLDPGFAQAHASLAYAIACLARTAGMPPTEAFTAVRRHADRALDLDPRLPEAHMATGVCAMMLDRDLDEAGRLMRRGLELNPEQPDSHWFYSNVLLISGRRAEARQTAQRARELDPIVPTLWLNEVLILVGAGAVSAALPSALEFAAFHPDHSASAFALG
ncbi:MAG: BTAD domain-containing putative transcriptional regulator, partial [Gemmatimonadota bacterium]